MFRQDFTCPALLLLKNLPLLIRDYHPLWLTFPSYSNLQILKTGLFRVRSSLLTESLLMSFPLGTEIFQFPRFCFSNLWIQLEILSKRKWVSPFGDPRIKAYWQLPEAYRSLLRPSSPLYAKASIKCPYFAYFPNLCAELNLLSWIC